MFEAAELGRSVSKKAYLEREQYLRVALLTVQYELREADFPVILVLEGNDRFGCGEIMNLLHEWMDVHYLEANVFDAPSDEELERPRDWRYWRSLPAHGRIGLYHRAWTTRAIMDRLRGSLDDRQLEDRLRHVESFERLLVDDGALLIKCWLHVSRDAFRQRLADADRHASMSWGVTKSDRWLGRHYGRVRDLSESVVHRTSTADAPWRVVESADWRHRNLTVAQELLQALTKRLAVPPRRPAHTRRRSTSRDPLTVLDRVDLDRRLGKAEYTRRIGCYWTKLAKLSRKAHRNQLTVVLVFEGWDAAGKGGVIRRVTQAMDAAHYRVVPIGAPSEEERAHHYLWRFWNRLPRAGHWVLFDRSWYGRVLVERLEGLASETEWRRGYAEINDLEELLVQHGIVLLKFWLHISPDEQLARFKAREQVPFKKYKITPEDYRNRARWHDYELAADEMIQRTSTKRARWHLVAANDKRWARIDVLRTVCREVKRALADRPTDD